MNIIINLYTFRIIFYNIFFNINNIFQIIMTGEQLQVFGSLPYSHRHSTE